MQSKWYGRVGLVALCLGVMGGTGSISGCASERDPINKVQPGVVDKTFFLGQDLQGFADDPEFRTRSFSIDSAATAGEDTIGLGSDVDRIRWEVTEDFLFARRSYQEAPGADAHGLPRVEVSPGVWEFPTAPNGTIVAAYKIESHFDIRRDYNAQTGEETNVIVENTTDRPWQDRQYMRIDWSMNSAVSTSDLTDGKSYFQTLFGESSSVTPVQYSATNEDDPDRPLFDSDGGYFDITNKYLLTPETNPSFGVSDCVLLGYLNGASSMDCSPAEIKMRHSYVRLTGNEDYEPFEESIATNDVIGTWAGVSSNYAREGGSANVSTYDPQYGYTDANSHTFLPSHNIWEKSHQDVVCFSNDDKTDDQGGAPNGTADACENSVTGYGGSTGSQCDIWVNGGYQKADGTQPGKCTIPVRDRRIKTIGYWLNTDAPQWLLDQQSSDGSTVQTKGPIEDNTRTWNNIIANAVATRREVECRRTFTDTRENCHALYFTGDSPANKTMLPFGGWAIDTPIPQAVDLADDKVTQLASVTMCHNPVRATDDKLCGNPGDITRLGDMRHNYAIFWDYDSNAHYGGVASIPADPVTGEMIGVTATTMMRSVTYAAAQQRDIIQIALGDITVDDLIAGVQATNYAGQVKNGKMAGPLGQAMTGKQMTDAITNAQAQLSRTQAAFGQTEAALEAQTPANRKIAAAKAKILRSANYATPNMAADNARLQTLLDQIKGTDYAQAISNRTLLQVAAQSQNTSTAAYQAIKQFASTDQAQFRVLMDSFNAYLANKGVCFQDPETEAGVGSVYEPQLAPYFKNLYGGLSVKDRGDAIYNDLAKEAVKGIAFHEIGHSLGMRHNFSSSWDSINFQPQYWQLRTNEGQSTDVCAVDKNGNVTNAATCMGPRYEDPETDDEQGLAGEARPGIEYFGNTSTMEYQLERFGETSGAGPYDMHFMKTLYGRTVETIDAKQIAPDDQVNMGPLNLSQGIPEDLIFDSTANQFGLHYTSAARALKVFDPNRDCRAATDDEKATAKWRIVHGKVCAQSPKNNLAYQDMVSDQLSVNFNGAATPIGSNGVRWHGKDETGKTLVRWAYRYGEDYSTGGYIHAKPGDSGADVYEITSNTVKRFDLTYPWAYFRRQNKSFAWWSLSSAVARNYFARLRGYHWETATNLSRAAAADLTNDDANKPDVMATQAMFNFLQRAILTPEPGAYVDATTRTPVRPGALKIFDIAQDNAGSSTSISVANVGIVDGRFVQVDFDSDRGGAWDYQAYPLHTGFDEEKSLAIRELVDSRPTLSTVSRDNALDGRDPYISFRTDNPAALDRLVGGILSEDWETIAPAAVGQDGTMTGFSLLPIDSTQLTRPAGASILFPNMGYQNELGTGIYGLLYSRFSTDMEMATKMRVRYDGDSGPVIPEAKKQGFLDPITGIHYLATKFGTEQFPLGNGQFRAVETGIASRMLQHANDLLVAAYQADTSPTGGVNAYGEPKLVVDPVTGAPKSLGDATATLNLQRYIGELDALRQLGNIFGGGPLGGGSDDGSDE